MSAFAKSPAGNGSCKTRLALAIVAMCFLCHGLVARAADNAASLRDQYQSLVQQLNHNQFQRRLYLDSTELASTLKGDIYSVVDYPFAVVDRALHSSPEGPANWCDVLILHLNVKYCHASTGGNGAMLAVNLGKKVEQELADTYRVQFSYRAAPGASAEYFQVELNADNGPLGTKDYRVVLEAVPVEGNRTFLHLTYSYSYGMAGRVAMSTYLATIGSDKVGFTTITGAASTKNIKYVGGVRGLIERNTMRYYLAIDAYLSAVSSPPDKQLEQRLTRWFNATEQYPRQLHELDRPAYIQMKYKEYQRQQVAR
ncbi:hypothetical protein ACU4GI_24540 [Cupriavidus basilensis]